MEITEVKEIKLKFMKVLLNNDYDKIQTNL